MPVKPDDFISLLADDASDLPVEVAEKKGKPGTPALASAEDREWHNDPVPIKLDKIRATFLNGKTASEVEAAAAVMPIGDWIETAAKMTKHVDSGPVQITAIRIELPPRSAYADGEVVEVELPA